MSNDFSGAEPGRDLFLHVLSDFAERLGGCLTGLLKSDRSLWISGQRKKEGRRGVSPRRPSTLSSEGSYCPNLRRYSSELMKALTISASTKLPPNSSSFESQNFQPRKSASGASSGLRLR